MWSTKAKLVGYHEVSATGFADLVTSGGNVTSWPPVWKMSLIFLDVQQA